MSDATHDELLKRLAETSRDGILSGNKREVQSRLAEAAAVIRELVAERDRANAKVGRVLVLRNELSWDKQTRRISQLLDDALDAKP